ncbi:hypothetical protein K503DRAFT_194455 [Rhizopogon vinicolor AM-OR11-026]|uniref:C3H1-type domain-containing protein n=1 Tax=Rhizopogon vinicolor AM-OR11-026 TaxID=1314800 RepID=A0A1B7NIS0_9AGAM|nr:hypothetical protein K503DRAFT_194455 [Rhizopogon vinicolor AM-OR11-026]
MSFLNRHDTPFLPGKMSLYKTMRCRYFDESGKGVKPFCNQGSRCRFIHPSDLQWDKGRNNPEKFYNDTKSDKSKARSKFKAKASSASPVPRGPRSSPLVPQYDLFKRNQGELDRERGCDPEIKPIQRDHRDRDFDYWERSVRERDRSRDARRSRERNDENKRPHLSKRSKKVEGQVTRSSIVDSGDNRESGSRHGKDRRDALQMTPGNSSSQLSADKKRQIEVVGEFSSRLAKLCSQLVQDSCQLDKEEERLKAFTELSSELSKAAPSTAMAVTPALAAVITSHAKCKERVTACVKELDSLWENLFSIFVTNIVKTTNINLEHAVASLHKERDAALQSYSRSCGPLLLKRKAHDRLWDALDGSIGSDIDGDGDKDATGAADDEHRSDALPESPDLKRRRVESSVATTVKEESVDLKDLLETVKSSLAMHSRALELLAKEKQLDASPESDYSMALITSAGQDSSPERTNAMDAEASPLTRTLSPKETFQSFA